MKIDYFLAISIIVHLMSKIGGKSPSSAKKGDLMRKYFVAIIFLFLIFDHFGSGISQVRLDKAESAQYVPGEILVKFKKTASKSDILQLNTTLGLKTIKEFPSIGVHHIKLKPEETVAEAVKKYNDDPNVEYAEPNYIVHTLAPPNDTSFGQLWGLHNTGQTVNGTAGTSDADIDAPEAWDITTGDSGVVIAVIDTMMEMDMWMISGVGTLLIMTITRWISIVTEPMWPVPSLVWAITAEE